MIKAKAFYLFFLLAFALNYLANLCGPAIDASQNKLLVLPIELINTVGRKKSFCIEKL